MKHDVFMLMESGYQAAMRDYLTYGRFNRKAYEPWDEDGAFENGYENYAYEIKKEKLDEARDAL